MIDSNIQIKILLLNISVLDYISEVINHRDKKE